MGAGREAHGTCEFYKHITCGRKRVLMTTDLDMVLDQRQLRKSVWRWRIIAAVLALLGVLGLSRLSGGDDEHGGWFGRGAHIARIGVTGLITENRGQLELLKKAGDDPNVKAVLLTVDSPGGTTTGGEVLYTAIGELAKKKPVVAVCGTIATSAAYMISLATDRIFVHGNTITGSVGVIFQYPEVDDALGKIGIKMHEIKSGPLKAVPSMFAPLDDGGRAVAEGMVKDGQVWFLGLVTSRRGITAAAVPGLEAGSIFSGRQALQYKLADEIGGQDEAVAWLEKAKGVAAKLPVIDRRPRPVRPWAALLGETGEASNGGSLATYAQAFLERMIGNTSVERLRLDGLVSVWHVETN